MSGDRPVPTPKRPAPRPDEQRATLVALATIGAGPGAWLVQLGLLTLIADIPCRAVGSAGPLGVDVETWWLVISVATASVALAGLLVAIRMRGSADPDEEELGGERTIRFLATLAAWSCALFLATILLASTAPLFLACP